MELQLFIIRLKKILFLLLNRKYLNIYLKFNTCPSVEHKHVISSLFFNNLIDVGANNGQFSHLTNYLFPQKKIIAFEPLKQCCDKYNLIFSANKNIKCINVGLGSKKSTLKINITQNYSIHISYMIVGSHMHIFAFFEYFCFYYVCLMWVNDILI